MVGVVRVISRRDRGDTHIQRKNKTTKMFMKVRSSWLNPKNIVSKNEDK